MNPAPLGYLTKQESIAVQGVANMVIRSLQDKQQFYDPLELALRLGISSGSRLAERMAQRPVVATEHILEIGCGLALSSLVGHRRGADMTASDCHPLAGEFLAENVRLNGLPPLKYRHGHWGRLPFEDDASVAAPAPSLDADVSGRFELIIGSDILYERDEGGALADFIESHAAASSEVWVVDPNRGNRAHFHRNMTALGFTLIEEKIDRPSDGDIDAYKGRMLTYSRAM